MSIPDTITLILTDRSPDAKLVSVDPPEFAGLYSIRCGVIWGSWNPITVEGNLVCMKVLYQSDEKPAPKKPWWTCGDCGAPEVRCPVCGEIVRHNEGTWACECGAVFTRETVLSEPAPEKLTACGECARACGRGLCKSSRRIDDESMFSYDEGYWLNDRDHLNPDGHCKHFEAKV